MSEIDRYFHEVWLGMVQPIDGLVVSIPVLVDAQCMERQPPHVQQKLLALCDEHLAIPDLARFLSELLGLTPELFDIGEAIPEEVSLYVPEGKQTIRPTMALKKQDGVAGYEMLVWDLPPGLDLDRSETVTGTWDYPPSAKFDRLLRHCRVPIGVLTNRGVNRLVYAPHGESSGAITFRIEDMASVGGRPILDAFVMLLSANRFFGVSKERALPALLVDSRTRQANVTNELADQVFEALQILLRGFESAAERDGRHLLDDAMEREGDHVYKGLLTVLLRLVFLLYAEDRGLLPIEQPVYANHFSVLALFDQLQADRGAYPDSMSRRFGAWGRLIAVFRAVFLGCAHGTFQMPPRRGTLFNPHEYPFLEGWGPGGGAPITLPESRAEVRLPTVDDETIFRVLEKLLVLDGQRLSYRALDVEQIGSVYEALMGYHVLRMPSEAVCMKPERLWVSAEEVLEVPLARRAKWFKETVGISTGQSEKLCEALESAKKNEVLDALATFAAGGVKADPSLSRARVGQLVLQPGTERRRTSSHYTPRSLSAPIVRRTLEPLLEIMAAPTSDQILSLKVCDPAMGSGAFLVEACRFLADRVLAAWTRENKIESISADHGDPLLHARRLVAQRCLYGVDKNQAAVELAKLSLWLVTLSKTLPFTFLDHSFRHGDSLVGLDFDQIRTFHWKHPEKEPSKQLELFGREIAVALDEAIKLRQQIGALGDTPSDDREKARLFWDAQDALDRVRLIGDLVVGAFFAHEKDKDRETERAKRESLVRTWLVSGGSPTGELLEMQQDLRTKIPTFHWMVEFPEIFYAERPDPLDAAHANRAAFMDAFIGNPPFLGGGLTSGVLGEPYRDWLLQMHPGAHGKSDLCAHFVRRADHLLGRHGAFGLIATNTVSQGDTRLTGLAAILASGSRIYEAVRSMAWPGEAGVTISILHAAKGNIAQTVLPRLDAEQVAFINSRLRPAQERDVPDSLSANAPLHSKGMDIGGIGFTITPEERAELVRQDSKNAELTPPYIGGEEVNTDYAQRPHRFVVHFGRRSLEEAAAYPDLLDLVRARVKPDRDRLRANAINNKMKSFWWQFWAERAEFFASVRVLERCLVCSLVTKHLVFSFQPTDRIFSHKLCVFLLSSNTSLSVLQSRVHEAWARLLSSTLEERLNYSSSDCFETFPFPESDPRAPIPQLESTGKALYEARAKYMLDNKVGLTVTYNRLKDPTCSERGIIELRELHERLDLGVLEGYGWRDIEVPPYCQRNEQDTKRLEAFQAQIINRLYALNAKRATEEKVKGLGKPSTKKAKSTKPPGKNTRPGVAQLQLRTKDSTDNEETEG